MDGLWLKTGSFPKSIGLGSVKKKKQTVLIWNPPAHNMQQLTLLLLQSCSVQPAFVDEYRCHSQLEDWVFKKVWQEEQCKLVCSALKNFTGSLRLVDNLQKQTKGNKILLSDNARWYLHGGGRLGECMRLKTSLFYRKISLLLTSLLAACSFHSKFNRLKYHIPGRLEVQSF